MTNPSPNVDNDEIDKFSQLAHKWWDKDSEFKPLHDINPLRLDYIHQHACLTNKKVLDVGCGLWYRDWETDRKSTRLNSSHITRSRMPSSA